VKLLFNIQQNAVDAGKTQYVLGVYDSGAPSAAPCGAFWVTHPVSPQSSTKVCAAVLDIISAAQKFVSLDDASKHIQKLWREKGLDKPEL
jgi:hypothetical protein